MSVITLRQYLRPGLCTDGFGPEQNSANTGSIPALFIRRAVRATKGVQVDGATNLRGSTRHQAVDTLGHLLAVPVTAANESDRHQAHTLAIHMREVTVDDVAVASVDLA